MNEGGFWGIKIFREICDRTNTKASIDTITNWQALY